MKQLTQNDLEPLAIGAAILGSGGGGDPRYDLLMAKHAIDTIDLIDVAELPLDALVVPVAFMGAPLVTLERLPSGKEFVALLERIENLLGRRPTHLMPAEIGGANAFTPLLMAARTGLPVIDADTLGRAFPELQMSSCNLNGISPAPSFVTNTFGVVAAIYPKDCNALETKARKLTIAMGSSALLATYLMTGEQAAASVIPNSYTKAIKIGKSVLEGTFLSSAEVLAQGKIVDIDQKVNHGFLSGTVTLDTGCTLAYQNEYLFAQQGTKILGVTPDILILLEEETLHPIASESLTFGLRTLLVKLPSPAIWKTEKGLEMVGPTYFGYPS